MRRAQTDMFQALNENKWQPMLLHPAEFTLKIKEEIRPSKISINYSNLRGLTQYNRRYLK
jgi:hypothetical protein